jgi:hypothetical protein
MNTEHELTSGELDVVSGGSLPLPAGMIAVLKDLREPPPPPCGAAAGLNTLDHPIHPC